METLSFVKLTSADIPDIQDAAAVIWHDCYADILDSGQIEYMLGWMYSNKTLQREMEKEGIDYYFIFHDGARIGYASLGPLADSPEHAKLHKLYLYPEFHGKGMGSAALRQICQLAQRNDYTSLCLNVNKNNFRAIKAYERNGFKKTRTIVNDIGQGYVMDDYVMEKKLS